MTLSPHEFKKAGEALDPGRRTRIEHSCGDGRTLIVSRDQKGISAYCFRCHKKGYIPTERSLAERIAALSEANEWDGAAQESLELPGPGKMNPQDWPDAPRLWLYKAGFSNDEILRHGWYWNPRMERVILPVKVDGKTIYWQGRGFDPARPKALNPTVNREGLVAKYGQGEWLALTEDILSAAKVGSVSETWALLGTVLSYSTALALSEAGRPVLLMLDDDPAGRRGAAEAAKTLNLLGVRSHQVYFGKDPKLVARAVIKAKAQEVLK
jgi:hypothetical protein